MTSTTWQWDYEYLPRWKRVLLEVLRVLRPLRVLVLAGLAFLLGVRAVTPESPLPAVALRERLEEVEALLTARQGELELARLELARMNRILENSARYRIPADLAASIHDIALAEGIDPDIAFRLVRVESEFVRRAVSPVGAVGLTQVMPSTAFELDPRLTYNDLFDRETNLRLGFRYLRELLQYYDGDLRLALLAYNRGPGTVDEIRASGGDPGNGYDRAVLGGH